MKRVAFTTARRSTFVDFVGLVVWGSGSDLLNIVQRSHHGSMTSTGSHAETRKIISHGTHAIVYRTLERHSINQSGPISTSSLRAVKCVALDQAIRSPHNVYKEVDLLKRLVHPNVRCSFCCQKNKNLMNRVDLHVDRLLSSGDTVWIERRDAFAWNSTITHGRCKMSSMTPNFHPRNVRTLDSAWMSLDRTRFGQPLSHTPFRRTTRLCLKRPHYPSPGS